MHPYSIYKFSHSFAPFHRIGDAFERYNSVEDV